MKVKICSLITDIMDKIMLFFGFIEILLRLYTVKLNLGRGGGENWLRWEKWVSYNIAQLHPRWTVWKLYSWDIICETTHGRILQSINKQKKEKKTAKVFSFRLSLPFLYTQRRTGICLICHGIQAQRQGPKDKDLKVQCTKTKDKT